MTFVKGEPAWNKGKHWNDDVKKKISKNHWSKTHTISKETRIKLGNSHRGMKRSAITCKNISDSRLGSKNPNWHGGVSTDNERIRRSIEFRLWREAVFARDGWICQKCKERSDDLHPHHIRNFAEVIELRFAIDNGITFCKECHQEFHKIYGKKHNTIEQLLTYLK